MSILSLCIDIITEEFLFVGETNGDEQLDILTTEVNGSFWSLTFVENSFCVPLTSTALYGWLLTGC